jgi:hypothetical protein
MSASVALEKDKRGALRVTFTCDKCGDKQSRPFQRAQPRDIVYCICGATAALTPRVFAALCDLARRDDIPSAEFRLTI